MASKQENKTTLEDKPMPVSDTTKKANEDEKSGVDESKKEKEEYSKIGNFSVGML